MAKKMTTMQAAWFVAVAASIVIGVTALVPAPVAAPGGDPGPPANKIVELFCRPGWRASAAGSYGGVGFGIACNNGRARVTIQDSGRTDWSVRMGVESDTTAFDCFFQGDSNVVNESCADVMLRIR